jgi:hypothetical protein
MMQGSDGVSDAGRDSAGHRWTVYYRDFAEGEAPPLRRLPVPGAMTAEAALEQARLALASPEHNDYEIVAVVRDDTGPLPAAGRAAGPGSGPG